MPTKPYILDGERLPGVTTILGRFKESGGLINWAWQQGRDGKDYRETRDAAADAGTCVHAMVDHDIHGLTFDPSVYKPDAISQAMPAFESYVRWKRQTNLKPAATELSLMSRLYRYGGTLDSLLIQGELSIGDWKSSRSVYLDYLLQLAAYGHLWNENFPETPITGGYHLLRFNKPQHPDDPIAFEHRYWSDLSLAFEQFKLYRQAYENEKRLKTYL
jgi:hypothetical protein